MRTVEVCRKTISKPSFGSAKLLKLDELETGERVNRPVYDREAAVAQYKECLEHANAIFQDEMQQRDIDAPSNYATNSAICYARMRNTLHEGLRYQLMHPR